MSVRAIRKALETRLVNFDNMPTAWENVGFTPPSNGAAYQTANVLFAEPDNPTLGTAHYRQRGYLQIGLRYPLNKGPADAGARADALRAYFPRGLSLTADGVTLLVERTPEISTAAFEGDRYTLNIRVRFVADIL